MKIQITDGIKVTVRANYEPAHSDAFKFIYIFSYRIIIENQSIYSVQLLKRKWNIFDSCGIYREVEGEGVIGQRPVIEPGNSYEYESFCNLTTDTGKMRGEYMMMRQVDGKQFKVKIPEFTMFIPFRYN